MINHSKLCLLIIMLMFPILMTGTSGHTIKKYWQRNVPVKRDSTEIDLLSLKTTWQTLSQTVDTAGLFPGEKDNNHYHVNIS